MWSTPTGLRDRKPAASAAGTDGQDCKAVLYKHGPKFRQGGLRFQNRKRKKDNFRKKVSPDGRSKSSCIIPIALQFTHRNYSV